ncbi:proteasome regulatory non-ATPase subunit [Trypanosoma conorhini]|uniref:Proteasome regulatory non-ATPase subunit n=1 Tax=Trypanosoma conorhini TaxID=83891 RepID=A0A3R7LK47_9TRYP|nr:proteasome regulatory non-ATPase subunit [Trypanosoma conorhini]RNF26231.1 proteasome regulatory non-ATPase subunit [Trypanosoma conorhini]
MEAGAQAHLEQLISSMQTAGRTETADVLRRAKDEFARSLWCEMTDDLLLAVRDPMVLESGYELHEKVLKVTRMDMSPMAYVKLLHYICFSPNSTLPKALELLDGAIASLAASSEQGENVANCIRALLLLDRYNDDSSAPAGTAASEARSILDRVESFIHSKQMHEVEPVLAALHCQARGKDYEIRQQYTKYYSNAFETVKCAERAEMPIIESDLLSLAYKTALSALLSEEIYNFGKFLNDRRFTERLAASAEHVWILEWLRLCNDGKVKEFEQYAAAHQAEIAANSILSNAFPSIAKKVRLMALLHLVFYTPFNERTFTFDVVARRCAVDEERVEPLLLAALAQGIIMGKIDGLTQEVHITWVEPRVLSLQEVKELAVHVSRWKEKTLGLMQCMTEVAQETPK